MTVFVFFLLNYQIFIVLMNVRFRKSFCFSRKMEACQFLIPEGCGSAINVFNK